MTAFYDDLNTDMKNSSYAQQFWIEYGKISERDRIMNGIQDIEDRSHATRTPLFQDTLLELVREVVLEDTLEPFPPKRFRDIGNGE